ncbi:MAG: tetratricopeptide repeat protein [Bacteroidaceae bacterium]|nr:tetratricopeptide repeat protein [Bacteroidaceae bacterium]
MKHILYILALLLVATLEVKGKTPKFLTKSRQAQVTVIAHDADGNLHEGQGVILNALGEVITEYDLLKGAVSATVIDCKGVEYPVRYLCGASSMYNMAKVLIEPGKHKLYTLEAIEDSLGIGTAVYVLPNAKSDKKALASNDTVTKDNLFRESYHYYTLANAHNERQACSPVLDGEGRLAALLQLPTKSGDNAFAIDIRFGADLKITSLDASNNDLRSIALPKRLPEGEEAAATFIYLSGTKDTVQYLDYVDEFIHLYPQSASGYTMKGELLAAAKRFDEAEKAYEEGLAQDSTSKDELHFSLAKAIYALNFTPRYETYKDWTLEKSATEAAQAYAINPLNIYLNQQAHSLYAAKNYSEAERLFLALTKTDMRSADLFLYVAQCRQMQEASINDILAMQDSAVACFTKPYPAAAANSLLMRGISRAKAERYREAIADYNEYEHLMGGNLTANFYYEREQIEIKCRMYPAAMNDIERAIRLQPKEALLHAECAALNYRVGEVDEAIRYATEATRLDPEFADPYRILGVCYEQKGETQKACECLEKAIGLGDTMAKDVLKKLKAGSKN